MLARSLGLRPHGLDRLCAGLRAGDRITAINGGPVQVWSEERWKLMQLVLAGKFNKVIADELNISMRTVEVHRSRVFEKMGVRSAVELAQLLAPGRDTARD